MDITQILSAFNLNNSDRGLPQQLQQNLTQNLANILGNQSFNGQTIQASGNTYTTQILINPDISDIPQEISLKTQVNLKTLPSFSVDVENINLSQNGKDININFAGKVISFGNDIPNPNINGTIKINDPAIVKLLTAEAEQNNAPIQATKLFSQDISTLTKIPDTLQVYSQADTKKLEQFLPQQLQQNVQNPVTKDSLFSVKLISVQTSDGNILLDKQNITPQNQTNLLSGKIEYNQVAKETIIKTEIGNFRIAGQINIPNNSTVSFQIENFANTQNTKANESFASLALLKSSVSSDIANLQSAAKLMTSNPVGAAFLEKIFPASTDKQSYTRSLSFISNALGNNDLDKIVNETIDDLNPKLNKTELSNFIDQARSLLQSVKESVVKYGSSGGENFYSYIMPFYNDGKLEFNRFYVFQEKKNDKINKQGRFAVELEQLETGKIEIEGVYNKAYERVRTFDAVIRSENQFGKTTKDELKALFADSAELMGFTGNLTFQALPTYNPHTPYSNSYSNPDDGIVI